MKKTLLLAVAAAFGFSAMALTPEELQRSDVFGYCPDGDYTTVQALGGQPAGTQIGGAFYLPEEIMEDWSEGTWKITQFHMMSGSVIEGKSENLLTSAKFFIREELDGRSLYLQDISLSPVYKEWNIIDLDTPFEIDPAVPLYIGVAGMQPEDRALPFCADGIKVGTVDDPGNGLWTYSYTMGWRNSSWYYGSLMMRITITNFKGTSVYSVGQNDTFSANAAIGGLELKGNFEKAEIFNLNGMRVASVATEGFVNLAPGTYAVSFNGMSAEKIIVK